MAVEHHEGVLAGLCAWPAISYPRHPENTELKQHSTLDFGAVAADVRLL